MFCYSSTCIVKYFDVSSYGQPALPALTIYRWNTALGEGVKFVAVGAVGVVRLSGVEALPVIAVDEDIAGPHVVAVGNAIRGPQVADLIIPALTKEIVTGCA